MIRYRVRMRIQMGLIMNRCFYGAFLLIYAVAGMFFPDSWHYKTIHFYDGHAAQINALTVFSGAVLMADGLLAFCALFKPKNKNINTACRLGQYIRPYCYLPASFCYLALCLLMIESPLSYEGWRLSFAINALLAFIGGAFSLHENLIVNERNRHRRNVCIRD